MSSEKTESQEGAELIGLASRILNEVLDAHATKDYSKIVSLLSESAKQGLPENAFYEVVEKQLQSLGRATETIYLGSLKKDGGTLTVWKVRYAQSGQEILWQLLLTDRANAQVAGLFFS